MSPHFQNETPTAETPKIGSMRWYATNLDYYRKGAERAINMQGENLKISRRERKLVVEHGLECTVCHRPVCSNDTHAKRTKYELVSGIVGPLVDNKIQLYWFWLRDALCWAIEEYQAGRPLYAFRAMLQVVGYAGKLEGLGAAAYDSHTSDAVATLRNALEAVIGTEEGMRAS